MEVFTDASADELTAFLENSEELFQDKKYLWMDAGTEIYLSDPTSESARTYSLSHQSTVPMGDITLSGLRHGTGEKSTLTEYYYGELKDGPRTLNFWLEKSKVDHRENSSEGGEEETPKGDENTAQLICQHDWAKLGFRVVEEENDNADGFIDVEEMPDFFQEIYREIDENHSVILNLDGVGDGVASPDELKRSLANPFFRHRWTKLIAKHPTEWDKDGGDDRWNKLDEILDEKRNGDNVKNHEKERIDKLIFWEELGSAKPASNNVYHFHPVAFVDNLIYKPCYCNRDFTIKEFIELLYHLRDSENMRTFRETFFDLSRTGMLTELTVNQNEILENAKDRIGLFVNELNNMFRSYNVNTCKRKIHFLAQTYHESMRFRATEEALGLCSGYKGGCDFRGRGIKQITHDYNYTEYYDYINGTNFFNIYMNSRVNRASVGATIGRHTELTQEFYDELKEFARELATDIFYAVDSAGWFSIHSSPRVLVEMDAGLGRNNVELVTRIINGGVNGLDERVNYTDWIREFMEYDEKCINR